MKKILFFFIGFICVIILLVAAFFVVIHSPASKVEQTTYLYIDERKDYADLLSQLKTNVEIENLSLFQKLASAMKYPENMKSGRYAVEPGISSLELVRMLRNGQQSPVKLTFNNIRLKKDFVEKIGEQLMFPAGELFQRLNDPETAASLGFDTTTIMTLFIPNTYEIYWNTSVDKFLERMKKEHSRFWTEKRLAKAEAMNLSPVEVSILASIVEEESARPEEYATIAGLYFNRLRKRMPLQADPTVKFAVGDVTLRRILNKHLEVESPYNTYLNLGLPPGPIRVPSARTIDAVLNYKEHSYLYMCAKEDFSGSHNFAVTLSEHLQNARKYQTALNQKKIY